MVIMRNTMTQEGKVDYNPLTTSGMSAGFIFSRLGSFRLALVKSNLHMGGV